MRNEKNVFLAQIIPNEIYLNKIYENNKNKIRDLFKVKLYAIRSETKKKREREKKIQKKKREKKKRDKREK